MQPALPAHLDRATPCRIIAKTVKNKTRTLAETFAQVRARKRLALMPFIPAGYPDLATTQALLPALEEAGADAVEIGFPFSDPIADGPTIQAAFVEALDRKLKVADIFAAIQAVRGKLSIPLVGMVSYSIVFRFGAERFFNQARQAGLGGLIIPDLPPPEAQGVCQGVRRAGLETVLLISPTTAPERRREIASLCSGFVYYLSVSGITGERDRLPDDVEQNLRELRKITQVPLCVGFGVSKPEHVAQLAPFADGAIVGSAFVRRIKDHQAQGPAAIAAAAGDYCRELLSLVR